MVRYKYKGEESAPQAAKHKKGAVGVKSPSIVQEKGDSSKTSPRLAPPRVESELGVGFWET